MSDDAPFTLRPMAPGDADAVQRLWSTRFGGASATQENWIEATLDPTHSATATVAVPSNENSVLAFGMLEVEDEAYTRRYLSLDPLDLDPSLASRNGIFHMYCVHPDWEGQGIGSALYARHLARLAKQRVTRAFGLAWHRPHTVDSRALFEKYGFSCLATVDRYYARFDTRPHCPDCDGACNCTASLHARTIKAD